MTGEESERIAKVVRGLLAIAEMAMPESYYKSDSRVRAGKQLMHELHERADGG